MIRPPPKRCASPRGGMLADRRSRIRGIPLGEGARGLYAAVIA